MLVGVYEVCLQLRLPFEDLFGFFQAEDHEGCGKGIGFGTGGGHDGTREDVLLNGIAGPGIDGMSYLLSVAYVVVTVVAAGGYCLAGKGDDVLQFGVRRG